MRVLVSLSPEAGVVVDVERGFYAPARLLDDVEESLRDYLTMYEAVLKERHIPLPYAEAISGEGDGG
ncbi:hypothetical protein [Corallococcus terminator]|uniref:Uncharacterized protein n=1 Tax=Corallococcus terminator TaxID=2316733 RepID=A0A3A8J7R6_9BACT|nr:hypothetical protein [Corallococcus terminator]RKG91827.1 hypothetical protein D7V88_08315 [Corallococcus terminator]